MIGQLTNHLWQSTCFAVAAGILTVAFRGNRAKVRYWLWLSASLKFLVPFSLLMSLGSHLEGALAAQNIAARMAAPAVSFTMVEISQPFSGAFPLALATVGARDWVPIAILGVWACGFAAIVPIRLRDWLRIRAAVRASTPVELSAAVDVRSSPGLLEPGVVGLLRPVLLLPAGIAERLTPPQLEAVLAHELCHIRRRDNLFASIHMIVEAMFWFHPLVWWIGARLVEERERACDEGVLSLGSEPHVYAEAILNVCKLYVESPLASVAGVAGANIKARIEGIMTQRIGGQLSSAKKLLLAGAALLAVMGPVLTGVVSGPRLRAQSQAATFGRPSGPKFEVASVKPAPAGPTPHVGIKIDAARVDIGYWSIKQLILRAFGLQPYQVSGPGWMDSLRFDILAKLPEGATKDQLHYMLQWLLVERFGLVAHGETKDVPGFALVLGKDGPKMKPAAPDADAPADPASKEAGVANPIDKVGRTLDSLYGDGKAFGLTAMTYTNAGLHLEFTKMPMDALVQALASYLRAPVIDMTGLEGKYQVTLDFSLADVSGAREANAPGGDAPAMASDPAGTSVFSSVRRLGLRLERREVPSALLVVDQVEQVPTEN
jgi:uncharacterized protein (TIGR03435 family)